MKEEKPASNEKIISGYIWSKWCGPARTVCVLLDFVRYSLVYLFAWLSINRHSFRDFLCLNLWSQINFCMIMTQHYCILSYIYRSDQYNGSTTFCLLKFNCTDIQLNKMRNYRTSPAELSEKSLLLHFTIDLYRNGNKSYLTTKNAQTKKKYEQIYQIK